MNLTYVSANRTSIDSFPLFSRHTPVYTECVFPESILSMRSASCWSVGFPSVSPEQCTSVSAARISSFGYCSATASAFLFASCITTSRGSPERCSSISAEATMKGTPIKVSNSRRRGEAEARIIRLFPLIKYRPFQIHIAFYYNTNYQLAYSKIFIYLKQICNQKRQLGCRPKTNYWLWMR